MPRPACRDGSLDLIEDAVREAGIRASLCYEVSDRNVMGGGIEENERFIKKVGKGDGQIAAMMGLHASFTVSDETLERCVGIAKTRASAATSMWRRMPRTGGFAREISACPLWSGWINWASRARNRIFVHCVHIDEHEMDTVADTKTMWSTTPNRT